MAKEIELKLEVDPAHAERLRAHPLFKGEARVEKLVSTYYDTPKRRLWQHGWTLRIRQKEDGLVQTIKRQGDGVGLFDRDEWECGVHALEPDWASVAWTPLAELIKPQQYRTLAPAVRSTVERSTWTHKAGASEIELAFDDGEVEAGNQVEKLQELELELKSGDVSALLDTARKLAARLPVKPSVLSKAERGFTLADGRLCRPAKATMVDVDEHSSVAEGFAAIVSACLKHLRLNEPIFVNQHDAEALHQMRVAVRRLRTALWLFKPAIKGGEFDRISDQLRRFTRELGAARNIDVILESMPAGDPARAQLEHDRSQLYAKILKKLEMRSYRTLLFDLVAWAWVGDWRHGGKADQNLLPFARKRLNKLWRSIEERADVLAALPVEERHHLRIDTKKIRYALEFLRKPLQPSASAQKKFGTAAEGVQDSLGRVNDLATRRELVGKAGGRSRQADHEELREMTRLLRAARRHLRKMEQIGPYWRE